MTTRRQPTPEAVNAVSTIAAALRGARIKSGLRMKDLTDRAIRAGMDGIRSGAISSYEHGRHTPTKQRCIDLLALCGGKLSDEVATAYGVLESDPAYKRQLHRPATHRVGAELFVRT